MSESKKYRILLIDDHEDARDSLGMLLEVSGHHVDTAGHGAEGIRKAVELRPDVALVDIGLPDIDGYEVAARIRAMPQINSLPLIAVTGYGQDEDRLQSLKAGFDAHLVKPINLDALYKVVDRVVSSRNGRPRTAS